MPKRPPPLTPAQQFEEIETVAGHVFDNVNRNYSHGRMYQAQDVAYIQFLYQKIKSLRKEIKL